MKNAARRFAVSAGWFIMLLVAASAWATLAYAAQATAPAADIEVFVREGCPHCVRAKEFLAALQREQPQLKIAIRDVRREPGALERLQSLAASQGTSAPSVPAFAVNGQLIIGFVDAASTGQRIRDSLSRTGRQRPQDGAALGSCQAETRSCAETPATTPATPESFVIGLRGHDISLDQVGLPLFTLALGLLDGFNPCSMWVLILMISLLAPMNNRPRMFAIAGSFVAVQGIAYFGFMAAWLNLFLLIGISRASEIIIAVIALLAGLLNLKDFWGIRAGLSLSIPAAAKPGIYARMRKILQAENLATAMFGAIVLAFLVQIVELMCTSGLPALFTRILTLQQLDNTRYYAYLLLYNAAYMLDDVIVLSLGILLLSQRRLQEKEGRWLKLISGLVMLGLGLYLLLPR